MFSIAKKPSPPAKTLEDVRKEVRGRHDTIGAEVAARYSRGNTSIQEGAFLMEEDILRRKKAVSH